MTTKRAFFTSIKYTLNMEGNLPYSPQVLKSRIQSTHTYRHPFPLFLQHPPLYRKIQTRVPWRRSLFQSRKSKHINQIRNQILAIHKWSRYQPLFQDPTLIQQPGRVRIFETEDAFKRAKLSIIRQTIYNWLPLTLNLVTYLSLSFLEYTALTLIPSTLYGFFHSYQRVKRQKEKEILRIDLLKYHGTGATYTSCLMLDGSERIAKIQNLRILTIKESIECYKMWLDVKFEDSETSSRHRLMLTDKTQWRCDLLWALIHPEVRTIEEVLRYTKRR